MTNPFWNLRKKFNPVIYNFIGSFEVEMIGTILKKLGGNYQVLYSSSSSASSSSSIILPSFFSSLKNLNKRATCCEKSSSNA